MVVYQVEYAQVDTPVLHFGLYRLQKIRKADAHISSSSRDGIPREKVRGVLSEGLWSPGTEIQYEPVSDFKMDGLQPRIDLRPGMEIPKYLEDEVDVPTLAF